MWYARGKLSGLWVHEEKKDGTYLRASRKGAIAFTQKEAEVWLHAAPIRPSFMEIVYVREKRKKVLKSRRKK